DAFEIRCCLLQQRRTRFTMAISSLKPVELFIRRTFLFLLRTFGGKRSKKNLEIPPSPSILLLRQDRLGDVLMSTFVLEALRKKYPNSRIALLLGKNNTGVIPLLPFEIEIYVYRKNFFRDLKMLRSVRRSKFDVALDLTDKASVTSSVLLTLIGATVRVGIEKENSVVYDITVPRPSQTEVHITERVSELLRPFDIDPSKIDKAPTLRLNVRRKGGLVGLNVSSRTADRSAPPAASAEIAQGVLNMGFREVEVFAAPHDRFRGEETVRLANNDRIRLAPEVKTFAEFAEQVAGCEYLITVDTSIIQIAAAARIPMVLMFKPMTDEHPW